MPSEKPRVHRRVYRSAVGRYRDATALAVAGVVLIAYVIVSAFRYQPLLQERSIDSAIAFGTLAGLNGAGVVLLAAAVALASMRKIRRVMG